MKGMTYRQIETSREIRLWLGQILIPAAGVALLVPEVRQWIGQKYENVKFAFRKKFKK